MGCGASAAADGDGDWRTSDSEVRAASPARARRESPPLSHHPIAPPPRPRIAPPPRAAAATNTPPRSQLSRSLTKSCAAEQRKIKLKYWARARAGSRPSSSR